MSKGRPPDEEPADPLEEDPSALTRLRMPALVAAGERDMPEFRDGAVALAQAMPQARHALIAGAGHLAPLETPDAFRALLLELLDGPRATDSRPRPQPRSARQEDVASNPKSRSKRKIVVPRFALASTLIESVLPAGTLALCDPLSHEVAPADITQLIAGDPFTCTETTIWSSAGTGGPVSETSRSWTVMGTLGESGLDGTLGAVRGRHSGWRIRRSRSGVPALVDGTAATCPLNALTASGPVVPVAPLGPVAPLAPVIPLCPVDPVVPVDPRRSRRSRPCRHSPRIAAGPVFRSRQGSRLRPGAAGAGCRRPSSAPTAGRRPSSCDALHPGAPAAPCRPLAPVRPADPLLLHVIFGLAAQAVAPAAL